MDELQEILEDESMSELTKEIAIPLCEVKEMQNGNIPPLLLKDIQ